MTGTGLSDGYPPGGVDAHEVCLLHADAYFNVYMHPFTVKQVP